ncbi:MAG TPA: hypothetical protein VJI68_01610 [Candidatus Nanoarchaeia archaeon]|nr:hypothetical protein [Candidatus Nanoarchaeia archaeon]
MSKYYLIVLRNQKEKSGIIIEDNQDIIVNINENSECYDGRRKWTFLNYRNEEIEEIKIGSEIEIKEAYSRKKPITYTVTKIEEMPIEVVRKIVVELNKIFSKIEEIHETLSKVRSDLSEESQKEWGKEELKKIKRPTLKI